MLTFISLTILLPHTAIAAPTLTGTQQLALQEEVNVLVYGVIQFSAALHDLYSSTAQKLDRVRHRTDIYKQGLGTLHHQAQSTRQKQREITRILEGLQDQDVMLKKETQKNKEALQRVLVDHQNLAKRLRAVEEGLSCLEG